MTEPNPGDLDSEPVSIGLFAAWHAQASENVQQWGLQDTETLLLAIQEEVGEMAQAHLEATHEGGDPDRLAHEMDDLGALLLQLHMRLRRDTDSGPNSGPDTGVDG